MTFRFRNFSVSKLLGFETFPFFLMVSVSVSKNFGIEKSIVIGFEKIWYRKKYRYRFRKNLVSKKVSVSKIFGIEKSISIGFEKFWYRYWFRKNAIEKNMKQFWKKNKFKRYWNSKSLGFLLL